MGFTTGVTGGVTLTLSLAYLAVYTHQRTREHQAQVLRSQARVLDSLLEPVLTPANTISRSDVAAGRRDNLVGAAKDRWNAEVANAARWVQHTDWAEVREGLEGGLSKAWGGTVGGGDGAAGAGALGTGTGTAPAPAATGDVVAKEVKGAWERAREKAVAAAEVRAADAKAAVETRAAEAKRILDAEAAEAKKSATAAAETAKEQGQDLFQEAKKVVGLAEDKVEEKAVEAEAALKKGSASSPVENALQRRYEKMDPLEKSVEAVLAERYLPTAAKDYSQLRGI